MGNLVLVNLGLGFSFHFGILVKIYGIIVFLDQWHNIRSDWKPN